MPTAALMAAVFLAACLALPACADPLTAVDWTQAAPTTVPATDAQWKTFDLPLRWTAAEESSLQGVALRLRFRLSAQPTDAWALLLTLATSGGRVSVNDRVIGEIRMADETTDVRWRRPHLLAIDPSVLTAGDNIILIQTTYRGGVHALAGVEVGPLSTLSARYERQFFLSSTLPWIGGTLAALLALIFGVLWLRRREITLGLLTLSSLLWVARSLFFVIETVPLDARLWMQTLFYGSTGIFAAVMTTALLRLAGRDVRRDFWLPLAYGALGPILLVVTNRSATPYLDQWWLPGLIVIAGTALFYAVLSRVRQHERLQIVVVGAIAITIGAAIHDFAVVEGWLPQANMFALHWAGPLLLVALATPLVDRFMGVLSDAELARSDLETRVREREQMLKRNYERLRDSERVQATAAERTRIMQDMHDGLGSQLLSSLMLVERGALSQNQVAQILRESIDDMRLAIDALAQGNTDLLAALGNLRYRMEPRFRASGIELTWDARGLPEELNINPDAVLPILRIVQEALTNALKHSHARAVSVVLTVDPADDGPWLHVRVTDNGRGISGERVGGRGLLNMRTRAGKIGAQLKLESVPGAGTRVKLTYRLEPYHSGVTRGQTQLGMNTEAIIERFRQL
jgi:signal transduction histidine kinase